MSTTITHRRRRDGMCGFLLLAALSGPALAQEVRCGTVSSGAAMNGAEDLAFNVGQAVAGYASDGAVVMHAGVIPCLEGVGGGGNQIVWTGNGDAANWHDPLNWDLGRVPAAGDEVLIPDVANTVEVVYSASAGATTIESLDCNEPFAVTGQTLTINNSAAFHADLRMTAGTLTGDADFTIAGVVDWSGGTIAGAGTATAAGGLALSGTSNKILNRTTLCTGDSTWSDNGSFHIGGGATFTNASGAVFDVRGDGTLWWSAQPAGTFINQGTFRKSAGGAGQTRVLIRLDNAGNIDVAAGRLLLSADGTHSGTFSGAGTLDLGNGTRTFEAASVVQSGDLRVTAGTSTVLGQFDVGALTVTNGTIALDCSQAAEITSYTHSAGFVEGSADIVVADRMNWSGGTIRGTGTVFAENGIALSASGNKILNRDLLSTGDSTWQDNGNFYIGEGATFTNTSGVDFDIQGDAALWWSVQPAGTFVNQGRLRKTAGAGQTQILTMMDNAGVVDVSSGTLRIASDGTHTGIFQGTAILELSTGTRTFEPASVIQCSNLRVTGGTSTVLGQFDVANLNFTGGSLTLDAAQPGLVGTYAHSNGIFGGSADLTITRLLTWTAGTMQGTGTTFAEGGMALSGAGLKSLNRGMLCTGDTTWQDNGNFYIGAGATFTNTAGALFDMQGDGSIWWSVQPPGTFVNQGVMRKSGGASTTSLLGPLDNHGTIEVAVGTIRIAADGTHTGLFTGAGVLNLSTGTRVFEAASAVETDNLLISGGTSTLRGRLAVANLTLSAGTLVYEGAKPAEIGAYAHSAGVFDGSGDATVTGPITWTAGTMQGTGATFAEGGMTLSSASLKSLNRNMLSTGDTTWLDNGNFYIGAGATFTNGPAATFDAQGGGTLWWSVAPAGAFVNQGTFRKSGNGRTRVFNPLDNSGVVDVSGGELQLLGDGTHSGRFVGGGLLILQGGSHAFEAVSAVRSEILEIAGSAAATVRGEFDVVNLTVAGGLIAFDAAQPAIVADYRQAGGIVQGASDLRVTGPVAWSGGTMAGAGTTFADGGMTLSANAVKTLNRNMISTRDTLWVDNGGFYIGDGATFTNAAGATFDAQSDATIWWSTAPAGAFDNRGTFLKSGAGSKIVQVAFANSGRLEQTAGLLRFQTGGFTQSAGLTLLNGGDIDATMPLTFDGGELGGAGTITADVFNNGAAISPGLPIGRLVIGGDYVSTGAAPVIRIDIAGLTPEVDFDVLDVAGDAVVSGGITADFGNSFAPLVGDGFRFLISGGARTGLFGRAAVLNRPPGPGLLGLVYDPVSAELRVTLPRVSTRPP